MTLGLEQAGARGPRRSVILNHLNAAWEVIAGSAKLGGKEAHPEEACLMCFEQGRSIPTVWQPPPKGVLNNTFAV